MSAKKKKSEQRDAAERQRRKRQSDREKGIASVTVRVPTHFADTIKTIAEHVLANPNWGYQTTEAWLPGIQARAARIRAKKAGRGARVDAAALEGEGTVGRGRQSFLTDLQ